MVRNYQMKKTSFDQLAIGESVKVREKTMCPDYKGLDISGWQGRIKEITIPHEGKPLLCIQWDSITLKQMPDYFIKQSEVEGLDFSKMNLYPEDVELTDYRDSKQEVVTIRKQLSKKYEWAYLGEQGDRIKEVLDTAEEKDMLNALEAWSSYLKKHIQFPFDANILSAHDQAPLYADDQVSVKNISLVDEHSGIIVEVRFERKKFHLPLCDLKTINQKSQNATLLDDYSTWFANR